MEINLTCLGTVGKTIAFDLCYLLAICIHKRLFFIIIVFFFIIVMSSSLAFRRHILSVLYPILYHIMLCELGCVILAWPWGKLPNIGVAKYKNVGAVTIYFYIKNVSHDYL